MSDSIVSPTSWSTRACRTDSCSTSCALARRDWARAPWWTRFSTRTSKLQPARTRCHPSSWRPRPTSYRKATSGWSSRSAIPSGMVTRSTKTTHSRLSSTISTPSSRLTCKRSWRSSDRCRLTMTAESTSVYISSAQRGTGWNLWIWFAWRNWTPKSISFQSLPKPTPSPRRSFRNSRWARTN